MEEWRAIPGYEGRYEVSDQGRVRSLRYKRVVGGHLRQGYPSVNLSGNGPRLHYVHRLVMRAFGGVCPEGQIVCHTNDIKTDNRLCNLRYDTYSANQLDAHHNGRHRAPARRRIGFVTP